MYCTDRLAENCSVPGKQAARGHGSDIRGSLETIRPFGQKVLDRINPIIAKHLAVGAAFSRDSRLQGAPARPDRKLTSGEFLKQHEIVIASCKSWGEMGSQAVINATIGLTNGLHDHR